MGSLEELVIEEDGELVSEVEVITIISNISMDPEPLQEQVQAPHLRQQIRRVFLLLLRRSGSLVRVVLSFGEFQLRCGCCFGFGHASAKEV